MKSQIRTRYAPSPTGYMHIGNLRTALYEYLIAKKNDGKFILRIEDTDQERYVEGAVEVIYKTLALAGLNHDEGPDIGGDYGPYVQSHRMHVYQEYAKKLVDTGAAYYCFCSREKLAADKQECETAGTAFKYNRHCLSLNIDEIKQKLADGHPYVIRQKMPDSGATSFEDIVYGTITVDNSELEDQVLIKSDGLPTYNFANVVDDHLMKITHVVRGNEYLSSTPKYNLLYKAFGWDIPQYIHVPMIVKPGGQKLSKRSGDPSFEDLIAMGYLTQVVVNFVALLGWSPGSTQEIFSLEELTDVFNVKGISKSPAVFDIEKLSWMNGEYIRNMSLDEFHSIAMPHYSDNIKASGINLKALSKLLQPRTEVLTTIPSVVDFFEALPDYDTELYVHKKSKTDKANSLEALKLILPILNDITDWTNDALFENLSATAKQTGIKNSQVLWPVRTALSGKAVSPGGATEIAVILGKEETLNRINIGIEKLEKEL